MSDRKQYNNLDFRNVVTGKNVPNPTNNTDIANKQYVDNTILALLIEQDKKSAVKVVSTTNITFTGSAPDTVDGVTLAVGNRVALVGQTSSAQNGIYTVQTLGTGSNGTWIRATDADSSAEVTQGMTFDVAEGTVGAGTTWLLVTPDPIVLNTTALSFIKTNVGTVRKYTAVLTAGSSSYTVTHSLGTNFTTHSLKETISGLEPEGIIATRSSNNVIVFDFGEVTAVDHDITIMG